MRDVSMNKLSLVARLDLIWGWPYGATQRGIRAASDWWSCSWRHFCGSPCEQPAEYIKNWSLFIRIEVSAIGGFPPKLLPPQLKWLLKPYCLDSLISFGCTLQTLCKNCKKKKSVSNGNELKKCMQHGNDGHHISNTQRYIDVNSDQLSQAM